MSELIEEYATSSMLSLILHLDLEVDKLMEAICKQVSAKLDYGDLAALSVELNALKMLVDYAINVSKMDGETSLLEEKFLIIVFDLCMPILRGASCQPITETANKELINATCELAARCVSYIPIDPEKLYSICEMSLKENIASSKYGYDLTVIETLNQNNTLLLSPSCALTFLGHLARAGIISKYNYTCKLVLLLKEILHCCGEQLGSLALNLVVLEVLKAESIKETKFSLLKMLKEVVLSFSYEYHDCFSNQNSVGFLILIYLWENIKDCLDEGFVQDFLNSEQIWHIVQHGLIHRDSLNRKRTMYFLEEIFHCLKVKKIFYSISTKTFDWVHERDSFKFWDRYLLILETLEERQVHIIKPLLPSIEELITKENQNCSGKN